MDGMVVVGVDAHKRTHTLVAVDELGRELGERTVASTAAGHLHAVGGPHSGRRCGSRSRTAGT
jgi:hypothetical protein